MRLSLLGSVQISWKEGTPPRFRSQRTAALLGYLVAEQRAISRDRLAALFWPDEEPARGKANLRRELYNLAQILPGCWQTNRVEVVFVPAPETIVDIYQFLEHEQSEAWELAAELIAGPFLDGVTLPDNLELETWLLAEQERWRHKAEGVLNKLITEHRQQAQYATALQYARQLLKLVPWNEAIHRQIMLMFSWTGQRTAALKQFEDCAHMLDIHFGVEPSAETIALHERIVSGDLSFAAGSPSVILPPFLADQPQPTWTSSFVARDNELARLDSVLQCTLAGQGQIAFVTGEAGSGKTRLLEEFVRRAQKQNSEVIAATGRCNVFGGVGDPYLPFREILDLLSGDIESRWVAGSLDWTQAERLWRLIPKTAHAVVTYSPDLLDLFLSRELLRARVLMAVPPDTAGLADLKRMLMPSRVTGNRSGRNQQDLFQQYTRVLQLLAGQHPLILVLDDLQWVDPGSIGLLFHLGRNLSGYRILIVGLYRADEVTQGDGEERHPLVPLLNEFRQRFGQIEVKIDSSANESFVEAYLESEPNRFSPEFKAALYDRTRGHALFTVEMMRDLEERGAINRDEHGYWVGKSTLDWYHVPARIEAAIGERIGRLPADHQQVLQIASVEGEYFTAEVVARVKDVSEQSVVHQLSHVLNRQHRLVHGQESRRVRGRRLSRYSFHHILFQQYLYRNLDEVERVYLHEAVGSAMEALYGEDTEQVAVQLARHFDIAGRIGKAVTYLRQAGRRARRLSAYEEAIAHFSQALTSLERLDSTPERTRQKIELYAALGYLHQVTRGLGAPEAEEAYGRAWKLFQQADIEDPSQSFRVQWGLWFYYAVVSDYQTAHELAQRLWRLSERAQDPTLVLPGHRALGTTYFWTGRFVQARRHWQEVFSLYRPQDHALAFLYGGTNVKLHCLALGAQTECWLGYPDQGLKMSQEGLAFAHGLSHPYTLTAAYFFSAWLRTARIERKEAQPLAEMAIRLATKYGFPFWQGVAGIIRVWAFVEPGQIEKMIPEMQQALATYQETGATIFRSQALGLLAEMCSDAGQIDQGLAVVDEALATTIETDERFWEAELHRVRGELLSRQAGTKADAEASFLNAISVAEQQQARFFELRAVVSLCRLWRRQDRQIEAREKLTDIYNWFSEGFNTPDLRVAMDLLTKLQGDG